MKNAIITGGTGFLGHWLLSELLAHDVFVHAVVRKGSRRMERLKGFKGLNIIELELDEMEQIPAMVGAVDVFYHLAWEGERNDFPAQSQNIRWTVLALEAAAKCGAHLIVTGSQAEYGICRDKITEETFTRPDTAYGVCKLVTASILELQARKLGVQLAWIRVFSVYGEGDNPNTLIAYLERCCKERTAPRLTKSNQHWDYLYAADAAKALYLVGINSLTGIYNLAHGESRPLREFVMEACDVFSPGIDLLFSEEPYNGVSLDVDASKISKALNWVPTTSFRDGINKIKLAYNS